MVVGAVEKWGMGGAGPGRGEVGGRGWSLGAVEKWGMGGAGADRMVRAPGTDGAHTDGGWVLVWAIVNFRVPYFFLMMGIRVCRFSGLRMGCGRVCSCGACGTGWRPISGKQRS